MAENHTADLNELIEPLRKLTGIDFAMGDDGFLHYEGELTQGQKDRLYGVGELDIIDLDVSPMSDGKGSYYTVPKGDADRLAYLAMRDEEFEEGLGAEDFEKIDNEFFASGDLDDDDPDVVEAKRRRRQEQYNSFHQAGAGFGAAAAGAAAAAEKDKGLDADDEGGNRRTWAGKAGHYFGLGVESCMYGVKAQGDSNGQISDRQLKAMIKIGVLEKGYDTLYFYDRRSKRIHPDVTARAQDMIAKMQSRGELPEGISVSSNPQDVKPWHYFFIRDIVQFGADTRDFFKTNKNKAVDAATKPVSKTLHNWGWEKPLKGEFAKAHDHKEGQTRTRTAEDEVAQGHQAANNSGPGASPA